MIEAAIPLDEAERVATLLSYDILDTKSEKEYQRVVELVSVEFAAPIALISFLGNL